MSEPCIITFKGKDYNHAEFMTMLHDGLLKEMEDSGSVLLKDSLSARETVYQDKTGNRIVEFGGAKVVVNKKGERASAPTTRKAINEYADTVDFTVGEKAPEPEGRLNEREYSSHVAKTSNNPAELVEVYENNHEPEGLSATESAIANYGIGKITESSFNRFGDRNTKGMSIAKTYFDNKNGQGIDQVAKEISDKTGVPVEPQDIVEFINRFPNGLNPDTVRPNETAKEAAARFEQITGLKLTDSMAERVLKQLENKKAEEEVLTNEKLLLEKDKINSEFADQIIADEGITTLEQLEGLKSLFEGFPYNKEDFDAIKTKINERQNSTESGEAGQESIGPDQNKPAGETEPPATETAPQEKSPGLEEQAKKERFFEEIAGAKPNNATGRISIDPILGEQPKKLSKILRDFTKKTNQKIFYLKVSKGAAGTYNSANAGIKLRYSGDLDTTAHEYGHKIDDVYKIIDAIDADPAATRELPYFMASPAASKPPQGHPNPLKYKKSEGFAEWLRAFIVNPNKAISEAPAIHKIYEATVEESAKKAVKELSNDIRVWAGSTGRDITLANIEIKPEDKSIWSKIFGKDEAGKYYLNWTDKFAAQFLQPMQAFNKAFEFAKGIKGVDEVLPENDPVILSRLLLGFNGKFEDIVTNGMVDGKLNRLLDSKGNPKNIKWLLEPLDNTDRGTIQKDMEDVLAYMISERTVELSKKFNRDNVLSGVGGGIFKDLDVAVKTLDEFSNGDQQKLARIKDAAERYRELADDVLKYMVDKGRLADETFDKDGNLVGGYKFIKQNNLQYVAMNRIFESEPSVELQTGLKISGGKAIGSAKETLFKIKGSSKQIANPYSVLIENIYKSIKESDRNEVMKAFRDIVYDQRSMHQGDVKAYSDIGVLGKEGDKNGVKIFVNGKPETWVFHPEIFRAIKNLDGDLYQLPKLMRLPGKVLQFTVTHFPTFAARNVVRDTQDRLIKSTTGSGFKDMIGDKAHWEEVAKAGGLNAGMYYKDRSHYYGLLETTMNKMAKDKKFILADPERFKKAMGDAWKSYEGLLYKSETVNRVAEYRGGVREAKSKGMDDYNAMLYGAYKARDLIDFAVAGHTMRMVNQLIPFTNAAVQGMRSSIVSLKKNPAGFAVRTALYSIIPTAALWYLNHQDEETAKEYEEVPSYQRDMYYNYKIGDNKWLAIPKPYELSLTGAAVDRMLSDMAYGKKDSYKGYAGTVAKSFFPFDEAAAAGFLRPVIEGIANYDFYREKTVIPAHEDKLALELRHTESASSIGKLVQSVAGVDARKVDHFIRGQFSYFGNAAMKTSDMAFSDNTQENWDIIDLGFFKRSPAYNSVSVQELLKFAKEWDLEKSKDYREFADQATEYFKLKDDSEKEKAGMELIDHAKALMLKWQSENVKEQKITDKKEKEQQ